MLKTMQEDLIKKTFTDTELTFEDSYCSCSISCHRIGLASVPYFYNLFTTFADSLSQKEFTVHVDDAVIAYNFVLSLYQLETQSDYPSWLYTLKMLKLRDFFCLHLDPSQLYNLVVPAEGLELLIDVVKLFKLADVIKDKKLIRMLRKVLPAELVAINFTQELASLISQKNKCFLVAGDNIELRDLESKEIIKTFTGPDSHTDWVNSLVLVDNQHFLSTSDNNTIKLWNIESGFMRTFAGPHGHNSCVNSLVLVDNQHFLSASDDETIKLWNVESGFIRSFTGPHGHTDWVNSLVLVDNQHFLSASDDKKIKLWNIESGKCVRTFAGPHGHTHRVNSLVLVDNQHFLSASADDTIKLWNIESGECVETTITEKSPFCMILRQ